MIYRELSDAHRDQIRRERLFALECDHFRTELQIAEGGDLGTLPDQLAELERRIELYDLERRVAEVGQRGGVEVGEHEQSEVAHEAPDGRHVFSPS